MQIRALLARLALWMFALLCWPAQGRAESEREAAVEVSEDAAELEQALRQGIEAYDRGDLKTARRAFEQVHARAPTARTLRSLGLVAFREQRYEDTVTLLEASLASQVKPLTESQREGAAAVLKEARARVSTPVDGAAVAPPISLGPAPAEVPAVPVQGPDVGKQSALAPGTVRLDEPAPASPVALVSARDHDARGVRLKRVGYALLGVAGAALIASVVSFQVGRARLKKIEASCREPEGCDLDYVTRRERKGNLQALGDLSLATGISAGVLGASGTAILLWRWRSEHNTSARAELGLGWQGVF